MAYKRWRELTKAQQADVKKRVSSPYQSFNGNPYNYDVVKGRVVRRHLAHSLESRREMRKQWQEPWKE